MTQNKTMENYLKPFIPGKGYRGICKFCGEEFYGRLNKLYHYECKIALNNQKASKINRSINPLKKVILKNDMVLRSNYFDDLDQNGFHMDKLIKQGFVFNKFTSVLKYENQTYRRINKFVYSINQNTSRVTITTFISLNKKIIQLKRRNNSRFKIVGN
jgi:hypothetical protein